MTAHCGDDKHIEKQFRRLNAVCNILVRNKLFQALIFSTYFLKLIVLILCKIILSVRNNFTYDEYVFLRILVRNLRVLCFVIYSMPTVCTPHYQSRLNLVSEICLVNILTFSA